MRELLFAIFKTGSGSFLNLLLGMITTKIFAVSLGPDGVGLYSLLRQVRETFLTFTTWNGGTALVQGLASRKGNERQQYSLVVCIVILLSTVVAVFALLWFAPQFAQGIFHRDDSQSVLLVRLLSIPLVFVTGMMYLTWILNGYQAIGRLAIVQVVVAAIGALLAYPTTYLVEQGSPAAFVGMMTVSSAAGLGVAFEFARREGWLPPIHLLRRNLGRDAALHSASHFLSFSLTTLITGQVTTWTSLVVRSVIVLKIGMSGVGTFDLVWTFSSTYITLVLAAFGTYYLPTLSQYVNANERVSLINRVLRVTILLAVPLVTTLIVLKPIAIHLLYSKEFLPALIIMRWMLLGDFIRATGWVFGVTIKANADKKALLFSEILSHAVFLGGVVLALFEFKSLEGIGIAFVLTNSFYLVYTFHYAHRRYRFYPSKDVILMWGVGLLLLVGASMHTWSYETVRLGVAILWLIIALTYSAFVFGSTNRKEAILVVSRESRLLLGGSHDK